jgi:hypothetical protein
VRYRHRALLTPGKILKDESTVGELKIKEKDFLVVMVSKVRLHLYSL